MEDSIQDVIVRTKASVEELIKGAEYIPTDKRSWSPGGKARSALAILQECAGFPAWIAYTLDHTQMPDEAAGKKMQSDLEPRLKTFESTIQALRDDSEKLYESIQKFPYARIKEQMTFPWGTYSMLGVMGFHCWNNTYHYGQFNYIQLLLGDEEMR